MDFFQYKRGNAIIDGLVVVVILFVVALMIIFGYKIFNEVNTDIQNDADISTEAKELSAAAYSRYPSTFDALFLTILILVWMVILVLSLLLDVNPLFFIFAIILLLAVLIVGMELANTYGEFRDDPDLSSFADDFPKMNWIFEHFLTVVMLIVFTTAGALFAKHQLL